MNAQAEEATADPRCPVRVHWWDCDLTRRCRLAAGHDGWHTDGVRWFDGFGRQMPGDDEQLRPRLSPSADESFSHVRGCDCDYHPKQREYQRRYYARKRAGLVGAAR